MIISYNLVADDTPAIRIRRIAPEDTVALRHTVLWPDKPVSYVLLPEDGAGHHFGAFLSETPVPVAVISLFVEPLLAETSPRTARFRKFACDPSHQGCGIGSALLRHIFTVAKSELGCAVIWCDGRVKTAPWYEKRGMRRFGDLFYKGPVEYVRMKADL
ncbi:hypothetical protein PHLGIDRAFT_127354 [Phlebiopsis gigantea 11061_1 CR5-6]|uniref:N-acetyltransferase domain-containing protein n=1 Tax=Phlebiopsis gigantea (strain 11061_1 CR5-6) TaxID=745531 RepID=A0A0C3SBF7_PHLG1|nr:hypothetical protein PHLGIDRAFT_127354 [Phlebiopsis gigantea 11061_1 CR5-6]